MSAPWAILADDGTPRFLVPGSLAQGGRWERDAALEGLWRKKNGMEKPTTIELFAGIGGFSSPHMRPLAFVEKEPTCRAILRRHYPGTLLFDDVRTVGAHNLPWANVVKFGFPCQDLSVAGNRAGLTGARSGLFYEATRIVHELRPDYALWENVPGLLSSGAGRDFLSVLIELDRIGLAGGWTTVDAQFFGVAQRRQRVFGLFARRDIGAARCAEILSLAARLPWNLAPRSQARAHVAATIRSGSSGDGVNRPGRRGDDDMNIVAHTLTASLGHHGHSSPRGNGSDNLITAPAIALSNRGRDTGDTFETLRAGSHGALPMVAATLNSGGNSGGFRTEPGEHIVSVIKGAAIGRAPENGPQYGEILEDGNCYTLNCTEVHAVHAPFGVRRLTPTECERLQGFPDGYTAWGIDEDGARVEMSDSVRYRMLGNAICKRVSAWLDSQIVAHADAFATP